MSTKKLSNFQKAKLNNAGFEIVDYDAISIDFLDFEAPKQIQNAIFTSQNAVRSIFDKNIQIERAYCVGEKTKQLLKENGQKVIKMKKNASELSEFIKKRGQNEVFYFFSGTRRRKEIPESFKNSKKTLFEVKTYQTVLNPVAFDQNWDGILFFSPSGVQSYTQNNSIKNSIAFCIGVTTASEAKKHTNSIFIAAKTTIESVIEKAISTLQND
ncbi:MAG: uroporphyrinogen-III synthase [Flavobacteriaceae bacterium]